MKITEEGSYPYVEMGDSSQLERGQWCLALGYPVTYRSGMKPAVRLGRILRHRATEILTDCTIMGGDSGGPLFDLDGKVVGIHSRVNSGLTRNIHVPVNIYTGYWDRMLASEEWSRNSARPAYLGVARAEGEIKALVHEVKPRSAAERAGIKTGDLIIEFDGEKINSFNDLLEQIDRRRPGNIVQVKVLRDGKEVTLRARLGTRSGG